MLQYADVNSDGMADVLYFDTWRSKCIWVSLSVGSGFTEEQPWLCYGGSPTPDMMQYADVDGDGQMDALLFNEGNQVWVSKSTGNGFTSAELWLQHGPSTPDMIQYKDINGDGMADALYFDTSRSKKVYVSLATGSGFTILQPWAQHGDSTPDMLQYADVNGDGRVDALYFDTLRTEQVWVQLSYLFTIDIGLAPVLYMDGASVTAITPYADQILTAFRNATNDSNLYRVRRSPNDGALASGAVVYEGCSPVTAILSYAGGVLTAFTNASCTPNLNRVHWSPDGNNLGSGPVVYEGRSPVTAMVAYNRGVLTAFSNAGPSGYRIHWSPDGNNLGSGPVVYEGRSPVTARLHIIGGY
jgi:hypothetical protein